MLIQNTDKNKAFCTGIGLPMVKKPNPVYMVQIGLPFSVETNEGVMSANVDDYLAYDPISGHMWPVSAEYVKMHYDPAPEPGADV